MIRIRFAFSNQSVQGRSKVFTTGEACDNVEIYLEIMQIMMQYQISYKYQYEKFELTLSSM